ncbi:DNA repair protein XRCC3 [Ixodes scapularis]|uniref:DNA repair protein XRCC3 n=1 Tax=Ixodes scapularis TaxID=6945 RepID=UPI001A9E59C5|nr:DNA repair protein XRCC3 [Ixodes scapularis]
MQTSRNNAFKQCKALDKYYNALEVSRLTDAAAIFKLTRPELQLATGFTDAEADEVTKIVCQLALTDSSGQKCSPFTSLYDLDSGQSTLSFGCPILDRFLGGGLPTRGVTELSGESGSGKTQFCLQLSLMAQRSLGDGMPIYVVYICTEDRFPDRRLRQMQRELGPAGRSLSDNVLVSHVGELAMLMTCLETTLPSLRRTKRVGLLVLDSVAALFRSEYEQDQGIQRAADLRKLGTVLDRIWRSGVAVLCVNQVTDLISSDHPMFPVTGASCVPSLGLTWGNVVTTRLFVSKTALTYAGARNSAEPEVNVRRLQVVCSPSLPHRPEGCLYVVTQRGVQGIEVGDPRVVTLLTLEQ